MGNRVIRAFAALSAAALLLPAGALTALPASAADALPGVIINEAYLSGGSAGAAFKNKFVELYNSSARDISLDGWSLQYRSASGTAAPTGVTSLSGKTIKAGGYLLVKGATNSSASTAPELPAADVDAAGTLNPSGTSGTIVLAKQSAALTPLATGSVTGDARVADLLGYGASNTFETAAAVGPSGTTDVRSLNRRAFADTNVNRDDFELLSAITPQGSGTSGGGGTTPTDPPAPALTPISAIQGTGSASPLAGQTVTTRGKVTAVYATGGFSGYYVQTPGTGGVLAGERTASDALFVFSPATAATVSRGDYVELTGTVKEFFGLTELEVAAGGATVLSEAAPEVKASAFTLPLAETAKEALEGMLVAPEGDFTVTDNYSLNQYGEIGLAAGTSPLVQPTAVARYGTPEHAAALEHNAAHAVKLDDGASTNFLGSSANKALPLPYLTAAEPVRVGSRAVFATEMVLDWRNNAWKLQPLAHLTPANAASVQPAFFGNTRETAPEAVQGSVKLATFNVLNYFTTLGEHLTGCRYYTDRAGDPVTVRDGCAARGAAEREDFERQQAKLVAAVNGSGANLVSLEEIENSARFGLPRDAALEALVTAINAALPVDAPRWAFVPSPAAVPASEDVIRTAFIYRKHVVQPLDESVILDHEAFTGLARQPLAQTFKPVGGNNDQKFVVIVNHFKSKGSAATPEDTDQGQGASNLARTAQAKALVAFADTMKSRSTTDKVFLVGDFNSYAFEDPMLVLAEAGYINQEPRAGGKHTYAFGGMVGSLDHVLASPAADAVVAGADIWNINSVESVAFEYSRHNYNVTDYYAPDAFRSSDHDPMIIGFDLSSKSGNGKGL